MARTEQLTPEDAFEAGAVYNADPAVLLLRCPECGCEARYTISYSLRKCKECGNDLESDFRQIGLRPYVIMGVAHVLEWENTVHGVPLTSSQFAAARPHAVEIAPTAENGLDATSYALPTKLRVLNKTSIFKENKRGRLGPEDLQRVGDAVMATLFESTRDTE